MTELPEEVRIFLVEAYENLDKVEQELVSLEKNPGDTSLINDIFRSIHTIKGNCGFLGFQSIEELCHKGESVLDGLRSTRFALTEDISSLLIEMTDSVRAGLVMVEEQGKDTSFDSKDLVARLANILR